MTPFPTNCWKIDGNCDAVPVLNQPVKLAYIWLNSFGNSPEIAKKLMHTDFPSIGPSLHTYSTAIC